MRRHHGRTGTRVIPAEWQTGHAPIIAATYDTVIRIAPAGSEPTFNEASGRTESLPPVPVYAGPASINLATDAGRAGVTVVDEPTTARRYEVSLPVDVTGINPDLHYVYVDETADQDLVDTVLPISDIERGDRRFSRVLYVTLDD